MEGVHRRQYVAAGLRAGVGRALQVLATLFAASVLTFLLVPLAPGSPATSILVTDGREVTDEQIAVVEHELGLDRPLVTQYVDWVGDVATGDLGRSWKSDLPVRTLVAERIGATLLLGIVALVLGCVVSVTVALISARFHDRAGDHLLRLVTLLLTGVPTFVLGLMVLQHVVIGLGVGRVVSQGSVHDVWLPACVLAAVGIAGWARPLRAQLLHAAGSSYARTMAARGATPLRVLLVHALPNAFVPFLGLLSLGIGGIIGGAPIVESVFSWPGLGAQAVTAVRQRDVPVIQAFVLLSTVGYMGGSLLCELLGSLLDPRRRNEPQR